MARVFVVTSVFVTASRAVRFTVLRVIVHHGMTVRMIVIRHRGRKVV